MKPALPERNKLTSLGTSTPEPVTLLSFFGWLVKKSNEHNSGRIAFASSENITLENHPQLELGSIPE
mgnify:FL=1